MSRPAAVIVLAAGAGTRMKSALPKVVHPVAGLSMIGHALRAAAGVEPRHLVAVVRHQRDIVLAEVLKNAPNALIADQDDIPGTGRAVQCALQALKDRDGKCEGTVIVTSGDVPLLETATLNELVRLHEEAGHAATVLTSVVSDPHGYGRIIKDLESGNVLGIVEEKDANAQQRDIREINAGIYAFDAQFLEATLATVGRDNAQGEVYLTDVIGAAATNGRTAGALQLQDPWQAQGANDRAQLAVLNAEMNRRICAAHMRSGVTIVDPYSTLIEVDVTIGADTRIWPGTTLRRGTSIGTECEIGPAATLLAAEVGERAVVPTAWVESTTIAADTMVEPFSVIGRTN